MRSNRSMHPCRWSGERLGKARLERWEGGKGRVSGQPQRLLGGLKKTYRCSFSCPFFASEPRGGVVVALEGVVAETWAGTARSREDIRRWRRRRRVMLEAAGNVGARSLLLSILCMFLVLPTLWNLDEKGVYVSA